MKKSFSQLALLTVLLSGLVSNANAQPPRLEDMDDATKAAFVACIEQYNMPKPGSGERPSNELREKFEQCLVSKGITPPKHHGGPKGPPPENQNADQSSEISERNAAENTSTGVQ